MARESLGELRVRAAAEAELKQLLGKKLGPKKRKPRPSIAAKGWADALALVDERMISAEWERVTPAEWVALYARLHVAVYGMECLELQDSKTRATAAQMAKKLRSLQQQHMTWTFPDDVAFAEYIHWAWRREKEREGWRRENNGGRGGKLHWRNLFGLLVLGEYQLEQKRKAGRK